MRIKGAIFDMDGTIVDSLSFWGHLWRRIGEAYMQDADFRPSDEVEKRVRTMIYADAMAYFADCYKIPGPTEEFVRFASGGIRDFYRTVAKEKAGARALLTHLREAGVPLCLASATALGELRYALSCFDFLPYFDHVLSCADIGVGKEKPDIYLLAKECLGLDAADVCVVEDSFLALETAKAAGFMTVGVYDALSAGQDRLEAASDIYLGKKETLAGLIGRLTF